MMVVFVREKVNIFGRYLGKPSHINAIHIANTRTHTICGKNMEGFTVETGDVANGRVCGECRKMNS